MRLDRAINDFIAHRAARRDLSDKTVQSYQNALRMFFRPCLEGDTDQLTGATLQTLTHDARRAYHHNTRLTLMATARLFTRHLKAEGIIGADPLAEYVVPRQRRAHHPVLTSDQVAAIVAQADVGTPLGLRDYALILVSYEAALRVAEAQGLLMHQVEGATEALADLLYIDTVKRGIPRRAPLSGEAAAALAQYLRFARPQLLWAGRDPGYLFLSGHGGRLSVSWYRASLAELARRAGIPFRVTPHVLRHSRATWWADKGLNPYYLQGMLGHRKIESSMHYVHLAEPNAIEAVRRLNQPYYREIAP